MTIGWSAAVEEQIDFLHLCTDDTEPLIYFDPGGRGHPVVLSRLAFETPYQGPAGIEPILQLTLVETDHWARYDLVPYDYVRYS